MKLKSFILSLAAIAAVGITSVQANAQEVFHKGNNTVTASVGFLGALGSLRVPPIQLSYEHCILDNLIEGKNGSIGIGGTAGYYATGVKESYGSTWSNAGLLGGRGSFHYQFVDKLDTYAGLFLGVTMVSTSTKVTVDDKVSSNISTSSATEARFGWGAHIGARYYFTPQFAANLELGYGISAINVGVTYRF